MAEPEDRVRGRPDNLTIGEKGDEIKKMTDGKSAQHAVLRAGNSPALSAMAGGTLKARIMRLCADRLPLAAAVQRRWLRQGTNRHWPALLYTRRRSGATGAQTVDAGTRSYWAAQSASEPRLAFQSRRSRRASPPIVQAKLVGENRRSSKASGQRFGANVDFMGPDFAAAARPERRVYRAPRQRRMAAVVGRTAFVPSPRPDKLRLIRSGQPSIIEPVAQPFGRSGVEWLVPPNPLRHAGQAGELPIASGGVVLGAAGEDRPAPRSRPGVDVRRRIHRRPSPIRSAHRPTSARPASESSRLTLQRGRTRLLSQAAAATFVHDRRLGPLTSDLETGSQRHRPGPEGRVLAIGGHNGPPIQINAARVRPTKAMIVAPHFFTPAPMSVTEKPQTFPIHRSAYRGAAGKTVGHIPILENDPAVLISSRQNHHQTASPAKRHVFHPPRLWYAPKAVPMADIPGAVREHVGQYANSWAMPVRFDGFNLLRQPRQGDLVRQTRSARVMADEFAPLRRTRQQAMPGASTAASIQTQTLAAIMPLAARHAPAPMRMKASQGTLSASENSAIADSAFGQRRRAGGEQSTIRAQSTTALRRDVTPGQPPAGNPVSGPVKAAPVRDGEVRPSAPLTFGPLSRLAQVPVQRSPTFTKVPNSVAASPHLFSKGIVPTAKVAQSWHSTTATQISQWAGSRRSGLDRSRSAAEEAENMANQPAAGMAMVHFPAAAPESMRNRDMENSRPKVAIVRRSPAVVGPSAGASVKWRSNVKLAPGVSRLPQSSGAGSQTQRHIETSVRRTDRRIAMSSRVQSGQQVENLGSVRRQALPSSARYVDATGSFPAVTTREQRVQRSTAFRHTPTILTGSSPTSTNEDAHSTWLPRIDAAPEEPSAMPAVTGGEVRESLPLVSGPRQPVPAAIQTASVSPWHSTGALKKPASSFHMGSPRQAELAVSSALRLATARHSTSKTDVRNTLDRGKGDVAAPASTPFPASRLPIQRMAGIGDATSQAPAATGASGIVNGEPTEPTVSGRLDELELERIADAVYEIIENRLIVERESLGL